MNKTVIRLWFLGTVLLALGLAPFLASGSTDAREQKLLNQKQISAMGESERNRLSRNYTAYQEATESDRLRAKEFHNHLASGADSKAALRSYSEWLNTVEPYQRNRLSHAKNSVERIQMIREILTQQRERAAERALPTWKDLGFRPGEVPPFLYAPAISHEEFEAIMAELERLARPQLPLDQLKQLEQRSGIERHFQLLTFLAQPPPGETRPRAMLPNPPPMFRDVADRIDNFVEDSEIRNFFSRDWDRFPTQMRLSSVLAKAMLIDLYNTRESESASIPDQELMRFLETLSDEERSDLMQREAADFYTDLAHKYERDGAVQQKDILNLFAPPEFIAEFRERMGRNHRDGKGNSGGGGFRPPHNRNRDGQPSRGPSGRPDPNRKNGPPPNRRPEGPGSESKRPPGDRPFPRPPNGPPPERNRDREDGPPESRPEKPTEPPPEREPTSPTAD